MEEVGGGGGWGNRMNCASLDTGATGGLNLTAEGVRSGVNNGHGMDLLNGSAIRGGSGGAALVTKGDLTGSANWSFGLVMETAGGGDHIYTPNGGALSLTVTTNNANGSPFYVDASTYLGEATLQNGNISIAFTSQNSSADLSLPTIKLPLGNLSVSSNRGLSSDKQTLVGGTTTLTATASYDLSFTHTGNDFSNAVTVTSAKAVTLRDANALALNGVTAAGALNVTAGGALSLAGNIASTGTQSYTVSDAISGSGNLTTSNQNLTLSASGGSGALSGVISLGSGGLTKNGAGTTVLTGANSYSGTTTINAGVCRVEMWRGSCWLGTFVTAHFARRLLVA